MIIKSIISDLEYMRDNIKEFGFKYVKDDFEYLCDNVKRIWRDYV